MWHHKFDIVNLAVDLIGTAHQTEIAVLAYRSSMLFRFGSSAIPCAQLFVSPCLLLQTGRLGAGRPWLGAVSLANG
jgi:hypothetical protein